jgi:titin
VTFVDSTGLTELTTYYYQVQATKSGGWPPSAYSAGTPSGGTLPKAPTALSVGSPTTTSLTLTWTDNSNGEDGFNIWRSTSPTTGFGIVGTKGSSTVPAPSPVTFVDSTGLSDLTTYYYQVQATKSGIDSAVAGPASGKTLLTAPTGLSVTPLGTFPASLTLAWTDPSTHVSQYRIDRKVGAGAFGLLKYVPASPTSAPDTGLTENTLYTYQVRAENGADLSTYSAPVSVTLVNPPISLTANLSTKKKVTLNWLDKSSVETGYVVERSLNATFSPVSTFSLGANSQTYPQSGLTSGTHYYYRVKAVKATLSSAYSNTLSVIVP